MGGSDCSDDRRQLGAQRTRRRRTAVGPWRVRTALSADTSVRSRS
jgi:hypothetical protein